MSRFVQLHALTCYPPSNPNRDDVGRPKTAIVGGHVRLRISSQAIKRAIRTFPSFQEKLAGSLGERTQRLGEAVRAQLLAPGRETSVSEERATEIARAVAAAFGKTKSEGDPNPTRIEQLAFISPAERQYALQLAERLVADEKLPSAAELRKQVLRSADGAADIAMFGRMLAEAPEFNRDAAVQVSHAFTTHKAEVEDDFYTAVDDLKRPEEDAGAGFVSDAGFGSGVFYVYACINRDLLEENLDGDAELASRSIEAFVEAFALATPSGKQNSFANHTAAEFLLVQKGEQHPRSLAMAFQSSRPEFDRGDLMTASIAALGRSRQSFERCYGPDCRDSRHLNVRAGDMAAEAPFGEGGVGLQELSTFASAADGFV